MLTILPSLHGPRVRQSLLRAAGLTLFALLMAAATTRVANAESVVVVDADSGKVLHAENATYPWYPASLTKLMTIYTTLKAVKQGRLTLDTMVTVSAVASSQAPSKMGFQPGTQLTLDNAMKMMMVKSANDMAVVLAEGLDGSIEKFADEMNLNAQRLGMTQSHFVNPNGLPAEGHYSSARDLAILARAIIHDLPEYEYFVHIPAMKFGRRVTRNSNSLLARYPGADGMKTGFICSSGYNLVASATRDGRRLIAVVLGAPTSAARTAKAASLLEAGFSTSPLSWLTPSLGPVENLVPINAPPPDLRDDICGPKHKRVVAEASDDDNAGSGDNGLSMFATGLRTGKQLSDILTDPIPVDPVVVYIGPKKSDAAIAAAAAMPEETPKAKRSRGKKKTVQVASASATKPATDAKPAPPGKPVEKPNVHVASKPAADDKPKTASDKPKNPSAASTSSAGPKPAGSKTGKAAKAEPASPSKS